MRFIAWQIAEGLSMFLNILSVILIIYALMTWFMRPDSPVYIFFARIADVLVSPFRPIASWAISKLGLRVDISVLLALLFIQLIQRMLVTGLILL